MEEIFSTNGGPVESVFVREKGFGHIRFCDPESIEGAMLVNGKFYFIQYSKILRYLQSSNLNFLTVETSPMGNSIVSCLLHYEFQSY